MAKNFIQILIIIASIVIFYFTWIIYPNIYSKKELYRKSAFGIFIGRTLTGLLVSVTCSFFLLGFFQDKNESPETNSHSRANKENNQQPNNSTISNEQYQGNTSSTNSSNDEKKKLSEEKPVDQNDESTIKQRLETLPKNDNQG